MLETFNNYQTNTSVYVVQNQHGDSITYVIGQRFNMWINCSSTDIKMYIKSLNACDNWNTTLDGIYQMKNLFTAVNWRYHAWRVKKKNTVFNYIYKNVSLKEAESPYRQDFIIV